MTEKKKKKSKITVKISQGEKKNYKKMIIKAYFSPT